MNVRDYSRDLQLKPQIVAAIYSTESLRAGLRLRPGAIDLLELRLDHFSEDLTPLRRAIPLLRLPLIITARHPAEGGQNSLSIARRRELFAEFLPAAAFVDVELRSARAISKTISAAKAAGVKVILSAHDFRATPVSARLRKIVSDAADLGADICKIATHADKPSELGRLLELLSASAKVPLAVMAMGRFGKISRLLFAQAGSVLNYGYLTAANASGQWPASRLRELLDELEAR